MIARSVAVTVVDEMKALEIECQYRETEIRVAFPLCQRVTQMFDEQRLVGQTGQAVVHGVVMQLLFDALSQMDVADRSRHAQGPSLCVALRYAAGQYPAVTAIFVADAVLEHELGGEALQVFDHANVVGSGFIRMQALDKKRRRYFQRRSVRNRGIDGEAKHFTETR